MAESAVLLFKQAVKLFFKQLSRLRMFCGCSIVCSIPSALVSTIVRLGGLGTEELLSFSARRLSLNDRSAHSSWLISLW